MSKLTQKNNAGSNSNSTDWNPKIGWHEVRIVGVADIGSEPNQYQDGKLQEKISVLLAFDEDVVFEDGTSTPKTKVEKFTASTHEKAGLITKLLNPAGISIESFDEMIGKTLKVKLAFDTTGKYLNISNADESENPLPCPTGMYVPKFWLVDKAGVETGFEIIVEDGIKAELMPKKETTVTSAKPAATPAPAMDTDEDPYA